MNILSRLKEFELHVKKYSDFRKIAILSVVLLVLISGVYSQVREHTFLNLDDDVYVTANPHVAGGITISNIAWAFTSVDYVYWHPITWLSHMADVQLFGMTPGGHHLTNVLIHSAASLIVLLFLYRATGALWQSAFVAFLFALHPLRVESVAWVAERKDVLSGFFWFLTLLLYVEFKKNRKIVLYMLTLLAFVAGIMCKPMVVTLPMVMLLMDIWPLNNYRHVTNRTGSPMHRLGNACDVQEKAPFFACTILSAALTIYGHNKYGSMRDLDEMSFTLRIENALVSYVTYIGKTLWPDNLAIIYPFPLSIPLWQVLGSLITLLIITAFTIRIRRQHPYCAVGWFWFLVTLLPVIGLLQAGNQAMADRFAYIPGVGLFIMAAWGIPEIAAHLHLPKKCLPLAAGSAIAVVCIVTWHQIGYWRDNISLYRRTLLLTKNNCMIHNNLGLALAAKGEVDSAIVEYRESIKIRPDVALTHNNLGLALAQKGDVDSAMYECQEAIRIKPGYAQAHNCLGIALARKGALDAGIHEYLKALTLKPDYADAHFNLGLALTGKGDLDAAIREFREALRITPDDSDAQLNLGSVLARKGDLDAAIKVFQEVLRKSPDNVVAKNNLTIALTQKTMQK